MDSSCRSEPQQFRPITVLRHPVFISWYFLAPNRRRTASRGSGGLAQCELRTKIGRAVLESNARDSGRIVGQLQVMGRIGSAGIFQPVSGELLFRQPADQHLTVLHSVENR